MNEVRTIQSRLTTNSRVLSAEQMSLKFSKLMLKGNVNAALRLLDNQQSAGFLPLSKDVLDQLRSKHPSAEPANDYFLLKGEVPFVDPVMFSKI